MGKKTALAALAVLITLALPARSMALNEQVVLPCVFQQALAILTCKEKGQFRYMGMRDDVYVFNVHYGAKFTEFYVQVSGGMALFTSKAWQGRMASARLIYDYPNGCVTASVDVMPCSPIREAKCCAN